VRTSWLAFFPYLRLLDFFFEPELFFLLELDLLLELDFFVAIFILPWKMRRKCNCRGWQEESRE
jgi:hypothetical protein